MKFEDNAAEETHDELVCQIRANVLERMDLARELSDEELEELIFEEVTDCCRDKLYSVSQKVSLVRQVFNSLRRLDVISDLLLDDEVTEIMVNGPKSIFYEKEGHLYKAKEVFSSEERVLDILQQIVARHNRVINLASPIVDTRLPDGERVNAVLSPVAVDGTVVTIRKFPKEPITMERLIEIGAISEEASKQLQDFVRAKYSILITGSTGSGKSTFLGALTAYIPAEERIITIEDSAELRIQGIDNLVRLETRNANIEGVKEITIRELIKTALRMRPDRIIVGECRGAEAYDMLSVFTTGHDGSLTTIHANSAEDAVLRLENMVLMGMELPLPVIDRQISAGIDLIVHLERMRDKSRKVAEITEILPQKDGSIQFNTLFRFVISSENGKIGTLERVGEIIRTEKLVKAGITDR